MTKTYGLMFKAEMIRAYLAGLKSQTRRLKGLDEVNKHPDGWQFWGITEGKAVFSHNKTRRLFDYEIVRLPYGDTTCTLWFKETWRELLDLEMGRNYTDYKADRDRDVLPDLNVDVRWHSAMFMPREHSRFTDIPILKVRVERLQAITREDAFAEGVRSEYLNQPPDWIDIDSYHELWDKINGKTFPWDKNPWVFIYEFPKYNEEQS